MRWFQMKVRDLNRCNDSFCPSPLGSTPHTPHPQPNDMSWWKPGAIQPSDTPPRPIPTRPTMPPATRARLQAPEAHPHATTTWDHSRRERSETRDTQLVTGPDVQVGTHHARSHRPAPRRVPSLSPLLRDEVGPRLPRVRSTVHLDRARERVARPRHAARAL